MQKLHKVITLIIVTSLVACVPARQYDDLKARKGNCDEENGKLRSENSSYSTKNAELTSSLADLKKEKSKLEQDTLTLGNAQRRLTGLYTELNNSYDKLIANNDKLLASKTDETKKVIGQLQMTQDELMKKQDTLARREEALNKATSDLKDREAKLSQLQNLINEKDSAANALKQLVSRALIGFEGNGLTVTKKSGNIYVSMEDKLLFASGSTVVDKEGEKALTQLAEVLANNPDISIRIEGHTDNVPISGGPIKDNWDLSVLRATSVLRILTKHGNITPERLVPSGRGQYVPLDAGNSTEAKRKNRRTEIILIPKLNELLEALDKK